VAQVVDVETAATVATTVAATTNIKAMVQGAATTIVATLRYGQTAKFA
jgi:hypothetical protein